MRIKCAFVVKCRKVINDSLCAGALIASLGSLDCQIFTMILISLLVSLVTAFAISPRSLEDYQYLEQDLKLFALYAGAANCKSIYDSRAWTCGSICQNSTAVNTTIIDVAVATDVRGASLVMRNDVLEVIVVSFRGTKNAHNLIQDIKVWKSELDWDIGFNQDGSKLTGSGQVESNRLQQLFSGTDSDIKVHSGFLTMYRRLSSINLSIKSVAEQYPTYRIVYTGHSLGGAMANLAAAEMHSAHGLGNRISIYTFGQPRLGNQAWVDYFSSLPFGNRLFRYANVGDPIVQLPAFWAGFRHNNIQINAERNGSLSLCRNHYIPNQDPCEWDIREIDPMRHVGYEFGGEC